MDTINIKEGDILKLCSANGLTYQVEIISINDFRPPEMRFAVDLIDKNGVRYSESYGDYHFCGDSFICMCQKEGGVLND